MTDPASPPLPAGLAQAIRTFAAHHPETAVPVLIHDQCVGYSYAFARDLEQRGDDIDDFEVINGITTTDDEDAVILTGGHFAVRVGELVIDWTYRQFDPLTPVPRVTTLTEWRQEWVDVRAVLERLRTAPIKAGR